MNYHYYASSCPYCANQAMYSTGNMNNMYGMPVQPYSPSPYSPNFSGQLTPYDMGYAPGMDFPQQQNNPPIVLKDYGPNPFVVNIEQATKQNNNYRTALWTGDHLQLTLMSIGVGDDIGLEVHPHLDQFIRIEEGQGIVKMGNSKENLNFQRNVADNYAFIIPAGTWHNLINTGDRPIKLYSIYAPVQHPHGTVQQTKPVENH
ncbi:cupin domain-containing protein [Rummeliibacillus sp. JY-2-4R]